ncbi:hypothetical protein B0H13DRAFT_2331147 [Mycena leptocephala]|nr:hypothetical protein B0H13DRAFT_2331147 [Mycena leptocephala]
MARVFFVLVSLVCMFQTLAAPLQLRAVTSPDCSKFNVQAIVGIQAARNSLGSINTGTDIVNARNLLEAQISLLDANNGTTAIADSLLTGEQPAPADSNAKIVAGLQAALGSLSHVERRFVSIVFSPFPSLASPLSQLRLRLITIELTAFGRIFNNDTKTAVAAANSSVTSALAAAQSAVAANCQTTL